MKGVVLAGGTGTRLLPMTKVTNKHLLPVYDRPMIYFPIKTLVDNGITDILIVSGAGHAGHFLELLGTGKELGANLSYRIQEKAGGIAEALLLAEDFADGEPIAVVLGDNLFQFSPRINSAAGACIYLARVSDAKRFGVAEVEKGKVVSIEEKPENPKSDLAVVGFYVYDNSVFDKIRKCSYSSRGELEITDVNNMYLAEGSLSAVEINGWWTDAGTIKSRHNAETLIAGSEWMQK